VTLSNFLAKEHLCCNDVAFVTGPPSRGMVPDPIWFRDRMNVTSTDDWEDRAVARE